MVHPVGFEPTVESDFPKKNTTNSSTESKLNQFQNGGDLISRNTLLPKKTHQATLRCMDKPEDINYRQLTARITYSEKDHLFHAYWNCNCQRGKAASNSYEKAKEKALTALKHIHSGQADIVSLPTREAREIIAARNLLKDAGINSILKIATDYLSFRRIAPEANLIEVGQFWRDSHSDIQAMPFNKAAWDWFKTNKSRWKKRNTSFHEKRLNRLVECFRSNACDLTFESIRLFFQVELGSKSPKTRNHYRETLRGIINHCVDRSWLKSDHGLKSLLRPEKAPPADPEILTVQEFRRVMEAANPEVLPCVAIMGFCGVRTSEIEFLTWEKVFGIEGYIELNAHRTKTAQRRLVPCPTVLYAWLKQYRDRTGLVWKRTFTAFEKTYQALRVKAGITGKQNCMRHSFASYRMAILNDAPKVASEMGNSPPMIYRNYRKLVTPQQAEQWFAVYPKQTQPNIIIAA